MPRSASTDPTLSLPRDIAAEPREAVSREWLVTNGLGGFASGTVAGCLTRRYHALLVAAIEPPVDRRVTWAKLDERLTVGGRDHRLSTNIWRTGLEEPAGCRLLRRFDLVLGVPTWCFETPDFRLWKRVWMEPGRNTTYVQYILDHAAAPAAIELTPLVDYRDYHHLPRCEGRDFHVTTEAGTRSAGEFLSIHAGGAAGPLRLHAPGRWTPDHAWYRDFLLPVERDRGFDHMADYLCAGRCSAELRPGRPLAVVGSTESPDEINLDAPAALQRYLDGQRAKLTAWQRGAAEPANTSPVSVRQLVLAADQFIVVRPGAPIDAPFERTSDAAKQSKIQNPKSKIARSHAQRTPPARADSRVEASGSGKTIIAGYPWFTDWGRDTMIALPGLTLTTGRPEIARDILLTFARHIDQGMLPNRFPDGNHPPEYHTADATLWFFWAVGHYWDATGDLDTLRQLYPVLCNVVSWHRRGTRFNIHVDDGLIHAGQPGVQLTWMDAKCGDWVVTPRIGKPVELSALWYAAMRRMAQFSRVLGPAARDAADSDRYRADAAEFERLAGETKAAFARFWNAERGCCYDVLDGPSGRDATIRPNQIFAVSLAAEVASGGLAGRPVASGGLAGRGSKTPDDSPKPAPDPKSKIQNPKSAPFAAQPALENWLLPPTACRAIVETCESRLLTWFGLRSLDPADPAYCPRYAGGPRERDGAYHQGTAWGWLLGPFAIAHALVHGDAARARDFLSPMLAHLWSAGVGSLSEIFDAEPPHKPDGCPAQAWSVAETLRAWQWLAR